MAHLKRARRNCSSVSFRAFLVTLFLGALNDNVFKIVVSFVAINTLVTETSGTFYLSLAGALFVLPFILFSPYAGYLADRYAKSAVIQFSKWMEVAVMGLGFYFLLTRQLAGLFAVLFLMGLQSTLFGPAKYGILPETLAYGHLSRGNGYVQFWTFLAIILGSAMAGPLMHAYETSRFLPGTVVFLIALAGVQAAHLITPTAAQNRKRRFVWNAFGDALETGREIRATPTLFIVLTANVYFWFIGALYQMNVMLYAKQLLHLGELGTGAALTALAIGIGSGSLLAGKFSNRKIELGLVPIGIAGVSFFSIVLAYSFSHTRLSFIVLFLLGLSGGFFVVPLNAYFQEKSPKESRGRYLATMNLLSFSGMLGSSVVLWLAKDQLMLSAADIFLIFGFLTSLFLVYLCRTSPEIFTCCKEWLRSVNPAQKPDN